MGVTLDDFLAYSQIKSYDVISTGQFKRHLSQCRDNGDKWAIVMYSRQTNVQSKLREVFNLVNQLNTPGSNHIQRICKDVMTCAQPPIRVLTGHNVCCLTGLKTEHCIDLTRVGKNSKEVHVHPRFWHFFVLLWYCAKIEYVIRACTKQWIERSGAKPSTCNYTKICEEFFEQNNDFLIKLFQLFEKGIAYTTESLIVYRDKYVLQPVLKPTQEFLEVPD